VVGVDIDAIGPELVGDFVSGQELAGSVEQEAENLKGLRVEPEANALAAKFASGGIGFECAEAVAAR
jgi:hypothetical protein